MRYKMLVKTNPTSPAQEEEYNKWYNEVHLGQILELPNFVSAERFYYGNRQVAGTPETSYKYLAIYDVETDDLEATLAVLRERMSTSAIVVSPAADIGKAWVEIFVALSDGPRYVEQA